MFDRNRVFYPKAVLMTSAHRFFPQREPVCFLDNRKRIANMSGIDSFSHRTSANLDGQTHALDITLAGRAGATVQFSAIDVGKLRLEAMHRMHDGQSWPRSVLRSYLYGEIVYALDFAVIKSHKTSEKVDRMPLAVQIDRH